MSHSIVTFCPGIDGFTVHGNTKSLFSVFLTVGHTDIMGGDVTPSRKIKRNHNLSIKQQYPCILYHSKKSLFDHSRPVWAEYKEQTQGEL